MCKPLDQFRDGWFYAGNSVVGVMVLHIEWEIIEDRLFEEEYVDNELHPIVWNNIMCIRDVGIYESLMVIESITYGDSP